MKTTSVNCFQFQLQTVDSGFRTFQIYILCIHMYQRINWRKQYTYYYRSHEHNINILYITLHKIGKQKLRKYRKIEKSKNKENISFYLMLSFPMILENKNCQIKKYIYLRIQSTLSVWTWNWRMHAPETVYKIDQSKLFNNFLRRLWTDKSLRYRYRTQILT